MPPLLAWPLVAGTSYMIGNALYLIGYHASSIDPANVTVIWSALGLLDDLSAASLAIVTFVVMVALVLYSHATMKSRQSSTPPSRMLTIEAPLFAFAVTAGTAAVTAVCDSGTSLNQLVVVLLFAWAMSGTKSLIAPERT